MCMCSDSIIHSCLLFDHISSSKHHKLGKFCILNDDMITGNDSNLLVISKSNVLFSCMKCISD